MLFEYASRTCVLYEPKAFNFFFFISLWLDNV